MAYQEVRDADGNESTARINRFPDLCPICHHGIEPVTIFAGQVDDRSFQLISQCPRTACRSFFISYYHFTSVGEADFVFNDSRPQDPVDPEVPQQIQDVSPEFKEIISQAVAAEQAGLEHVAGAGYRKAFEFLIKDFAISEEEDESEHETIATEYLGRIIANRLDDAKLQAVAKRAAWLGNDEVHYKRIWEEMGIDQLKTLIQLAMNFIESEKLVQEFEEAMPEQGDQE